MSRVAIDVDGVLANFSKGAIEVINKLWPGRLPYDYEPSDWNWSDVVTDKEWSKVWRVIKDSNNWWLGLDAYSDNVGALARWFLTQTNQDVWLVTSRANTRGITTTKQTEWWIRSCGVTPVNNFLGIITVPLAENKWKIYEAAKIEWSIDDKGETVEECNAHIDTFEHRAYLLDRPWNKSYGVYRRIGSVEAFLKEIK